MLEESEQRVGIRNDNEDWFTMTKLNLIKAKIT